MAALLPWHAALAACTAPRRLRLPRGHIDGSEACEKLALLGDSLLHTCALRQLGLSATVEQQLTPGAITSRVSNALSNRTMAGCAESLLVLPPSLNAEYVSANDLRVTPTHGLGTTLEAAAALVHDSNPPEVAQAALSCVAKTLLAAASTLSNWKGVLLEQGGRVESTSVGTVHAPAFTAQAWLGEHVVTADAWPNKGAAEAHAAQMALELAGLGSEEARAGAREAATMAALRSQAAANAAAVDASRAMVGTEVPLTFTPFVLPAQAIAGARSEGMPWFTRGLAKEPFPRLLGAPVLFADRVAGVQCWQSSLSGEDGGTVLGLAVIAVTLPDGTRRWVWSGPHASNSAARSAAAREAIAALGLAA
jgi:dsRNA-specific ribonuclease